MHDKNSGDASYLKKQQFEAVAVEAVPVVV
jgi:hypothetical protein